MDRIEFYSYYIPALNKALEALKIELHREFISGPELFLEAPNSILMEIDNYIDNNSGKDEFLDLVGYYFDAITHGFTSIDGEDIEKCRLKIIKMIDEYPRWV